MPEHDELPTELLAIVLSLLPSGQAAVAARTCKRWWSLRCPKERRLLLASVACSSVAMLEWALGNGYPFFSDGRTCDLAAVQGNLEVLQWIIKRGSPWSSTTCAMAAAGGHLELLRWARKQGCPWDPMSPCIEAARCGRLEVLQWACHNGGHITEWALIRALVLGCKDLQRCCKDLPFGGAEMGERERVLLGWRDLQAGSAGRGFGRVQVGSGERLSLGQGSMHSGSKEKEPLTGQKKLCWEQKWQLMAM